MARLARLVVAGLPHHVTQRGNRDRGQGPGDRGQVLQSNMLVRMLLSSSRDFEVDICEGDFGSFFGRVCWLGVFPATIRNSPVKSER